MKIEEILTTKFWDLLGTKFDTEGFTPLGAVIRQNAEWLYMYIKLEYGGMGCLEIDGLTDETAVPMFYAMYGLAFSRIYDSLIVDYNPLENYFTDRDYSENGSGTSTRNGEVTTTPTGSISTTSTGEKEHQFNNVSNVSQGTTFENASTNPNADDFHNISKNIQSGSEKEINNNVGTNTTYNDYVVTQRYNDVVDSTSADKSGEEHRRGNSGIFSKQDLTQREINLRIKNRIFPILCRMSVDMFNSGVWYT